MSSSFGQIASNIASSKYSDLKISVTGDYSTSSASSVAGELTGAAINIAGLLLASSIEKSDNVTDSQKESASKVTAYTQAVTQSKVQEAMVENLTKTQTELQAQITEAEGADTAIKELNRQLSQLDGDNGVHDGNPTGNALENYNNAVKSLNEAKEDKAKVATLDNDIQAAKQNFDNIKNNSFATTGHKSITIKCDGKAVSNVKSSNYDLPADQKNYDNDLAQAQKMDQDYENAERAIKDKENEKKTITNKYNGQSIDDAISTRQQNVEEYGNKDMDGAKGGLTAAQYTEKKQEIQDKIKDLKAKKANLNNLKSRKEAIDKQLATAQTQLDATKAQVDALKASLSGEASQYAAMQDAQANYNQEQSDLANAKKLTGKNGKKRTWLQKLFGTNKSASLKAAQQDAKTAKKTYKAAQNTVNSSMTADTIETMKKLGILGTDST